MQKWIGTGRLTADPTIRYSQGKKPCCFAKFTLAVNRRFKRENEPNADFINCTAVGKTAEVIEKYFTKGMKMEVVGEIRTGSYTNKDGVKVFTDNLARNDVIRRLSLPCGRCVGCRLERSRQWAVRCMHEASMHMFNSFVTLTYDDNHLPEYNSLNYKHFQDFMKRLRKSHNGVRFYMCGEYGEDFSRPHYHAIVTGKQIGRAHV